MSCVSPHKCGHRQAASVGRRCWSIIVFLTSQLDINTEGWGWGVMKAKVYKNQEALLVTWHWHQTMTVSWKLRQALTVQRAVINRTRKKKQSGQRNKKELTAQKWINTYYRKKRIIIHRKKKCNVKGLKRSIIIFLRPGFTVLWLYEVPVFLLLILSTCLCLFVERWHRKQQLTHWCDQVFVCVKVGDNVCECVQFYRKLTDWELGWW